MVMKVELLRNTYLDGQPVWVGDVIEVSAEDGRFLIGAGKATAVVEPDEAPKKKTVTKATKAGKETAALAVDAGTADDGEQGED